MRHLKTLFK